jgi:EAL domain-containing protein (putative c-di-GMP-specific phosphodiesterase class I)
LQDLTKRAGTGAHTLILVEVANLGDLIALHGHLWGESFWKALEQVLKQLFEGALLGKYQPCLFLFSDALLAITLHGASMAEVQRLDLLPALRDELDRSLRERATTDSLLPRLNYGVAELQSESVVSVEMAMRNLSLALRSDDQPIGYFAPSLVRRAAQDERIRRLLTEWIDNRTPPLHYQPKIEFATGRTLGAEALLRACDEDGERISPQRVLKVATQQQLLVEFEWSTIEAVVRDLRRCKDSATGLLSLSVNVSSVSLLDPEFASRVVCLLRSASVDSESLSLEVTEAIPVPELDSVCDNMMVLRKAGVRLSLDDFGTGYSALALLAQFPFNEVKIDHSMVSRLDQPRMRVAVSLALESAQRYSANLVAEGVETQRQLETLIQLGVRCGQGYLFSAAVPLTQLVF